MAIMMAGSRKKGFLPCKINANVNNKWAKDNCVKAYSKKNIYRSKNTLEFNSCTLHRWTSDLNEDRVITIYALLCFSLEEFHRHNNGEKFLSWVKPNINPSPCTTAQFFVTPTRHTDKVKLEQHCIYHSASALWDLVRGHGAEKNLKAARILSANIQHTESSLQRTLKAGAAPDRLVLSTNHSLHVDSRTSP